MSKDYLENNTDIEIMNKINKEIKGPQSKNIDLYIMEKDKEIINLCTQNKSLITEIENLKRINKEQESQITLLKADLKTYETDKNIILKENEKLNEQINNLKNELLIKEDKFNEILKKNDENVKEISNSYNIQIKNYEDNLKNIQYIQTNNNSLTEKLLLKDKEIIDMQKIIYDLKQENKKYFNLENEIKEKNEIIFNLKQHINKLEKDNFIYGKNNNLILNNSQYNYDYKNNINNPYNKNFNNFKDKAFNDYSNYVNNNLISFIIEQIKKVESSIDNKNNQSFNNIFYNNELLNENNSTFELIKQNFDLLINKIKFLHQDYSKNRIDVINELNKEKNKNMQLSNDIKIIQQNSKNEIISLKQILDKKTGEIKQLSDKLNLVISTQNNNGNIFSNLFVKQYNDIFSTLKNFYDFYINIGANKGQIKGKGINLKLPNFSLSDNIDKKINDIFYTLKTIINYIENNFKNNKININTNNNNKNSFDNYMNEINDLNMKIKKLSELFNKNENLLKTITNENQFLKQKNAQLENILNPKNKTNQLNNNKQNNNPININTNKNKNDLWKMSDGFNSNISNNNFNNTSPEIDNREKKSNLELKDLISLQKSKNDNLLNDFYDKNQKIISLENEANKLIKENYVGDKNKIFNQNNNNLNNFNINNQIYTFKNESPEIQYEEGKDEVEEEEEINDDIQNNIENNNEARFNNGNMEENEIYDEYDENNISNEAEIFTNEDEQFNDDNNNY